MRLIPYPKAKPYAPELPPAINGSLNCDPFAGTAWEQIISVPPIYGNFRILG